MSSVRPIVVDGAGEWLRGKRCAVVGLGVSSQSSGLVNPLPVASKLIELIENVGGEVVSIVDSVSPFNSVGELDKAFVGIDVLFLVGHFVSFSHGDREKAWRMNLNAAQSVYLAAEMAGVKRIVTHGSILSLGHNPDGSPVDISSPYLSDNRRTECEKSLYRAEMEAWKMSECGFPVTVVCSGFLTDDSFINLGLTADDINQNAHLFSSPETVANALIAASNDNLIGRRLICSGLSQGCDLSVSSEAIKMRKDNALLRLLCRDRRSLALRVLRRLGTYISDFPVSTDLN